MVSGETSIVKRIAGTGNNAAKEPFFTEWNEPGNGEPVSDRRLVRAMFIP